MNSKVKLLMVALSVVSMQTHSAIEVDDSRVIEPTKSSYQFESRGLNFKRERKIGVGLSTAGALGFLGANLEINFTPEDSFMADSEWETVTKAMPSNTSTLLAAVGLYPMWGVAMRDGLLLPRMDELTTVRLAFSQTSFYQSVS
jgi:hypothetical protein